jgi:hypothetical protein
MYDEKCMRKADELLRRAAETSNMKERGRLIDEAMHWHLLASEGRGQPDESAGEGAADRAQDERK